MIFRRFWTAAGACWLVVALVSGCFLFNRPAAQLACPASQPTSCPTAFAPGNYDRSLVHEGLTRNFKIHVPPQYTGTSPTPLVLMLHGGLGNAEITSKYYGWSEKSDAVGFIVVYPDGVGRTWNAEHCCGKARRDGVDDVGFLAALIGELKKTFNVDAKRVYMTGMSNGAMMSHRFGAERPDLVAAIGPVAGSIGGQVNGRSPVVKPDPPSEHVAVIIFHGSEDEHVLYEGGLTKKGVVPGRIDLSVAESVQFWVEADAANTTPVKEPNAAGDVVKDTYAATDGYADVVLYTVMGQGHAWPGGTKPRFVADVPSTSIDATSVMWEFFAAHPKP